jgi:hypothetical protein
MALRYNFSLLPIVFCCHLCNGTLVIRTFFQDHGFESHMLHQAVDPFVVILVPYLGIQLIQRRNKIDPPVCLLSN